MKFQIPRLDITFAFTNKQPPWTKFFKKLTESAVILLIRAYQVVLSPAKIAIFGPTARCRFSPSCSNFALSMFKRYNLGKAFYLSVKRISRCHPFWKHRTK
ncbi:MAG: membrane protein insertion efficiency factor YidD [Puniceicoccales bacterium]|nr:membrane protein insertion efficiency factor YidD [Puniceicoccales bacterium]